MLETENYTLGSDTAKLLMELLDPFVTALDHLYDLAVAVEAAEKEVSLSDLAVKRALILLRWFKITPEFMRVPSSILGKMYQFSFVG